MVAEQKALFGLLGAMSAAVVVSGAACSGDTTDKVAQTDPVISDAMPMDASAAVLEGGSVSLAEWEARIAPRTEPHEIDSQDCEGDPIGNAYQVLPSVVCRNAPDYDYQTNPVLLCDLEPYCMQHGDCTDSPHGRCVGFATSDCTFPDANSVYDRECTSDLDCDDLPTGRCSPEEGIDMCYPTGECHHRTCSFTRDPCTSDADCAYLPGGFCQRAIMMSHCAYYECLTDSDCGIGKRCGCHFCVPSQCTNDTDCGAAQTCRLDIGCLGRALGYFCTTSLDQCASSADCGGFECDHVGDRWQCVTYCPETP